MNSINCKVPKSNDDNWNYFRYYRSSEEKVGWGSKYLVQVLVRASASTHGDVHVVLGKNKSLPVIDVGVVGTNPLELFMHHIRGFYERRLICTDTTWAPDAWCNCGVFRKMPSCKIALGRILHAFSHKHCIEYRVWTYIEDSVFDWWVAVPTEEEKVWKEIIPNHTIYGL